MNLRGNIWRLYAVNDDDQGGAVPSGTIVYRDIYSRISPLQPTMAILEQGIETVQIFSGVFQYPAFNITGGFNVLENDVFEVTWPPISAHINKKFIFIGIQFQSYDDSRKYLVGQLRRLVTANSNNLQA